MVLRDMVLICHSLPSGVKTALPFLDCLSPPAPAPQNKGASSLPTAVWPDGTVFPATWTCACELEATQVGAQPHAPETHGWETAAGGAHQGDL